MHELSVTQVILETALRHAPPRTQVTDLYLVIGELSSYVDDSVQFYWDMISAGTAAAGARLHFKRIPTEMTCQVCDHHYSPRTALTCPPCDSLQVTVSDGDAFYLDAIEVTRTAEVDMPQSTPGAPGD